MLYSILQLINMMIFKLFFKTKRAGVENLPLTGALILVANHSSYLDPFALAATASRKISFMMLESAYSKPLLRPICSRILCIPVKRDDRDLRALKRALKVIEKDGVLGIFPEGRMSLDVRLGEGRDGAAMIALRTGIPVLPVAITGASKAYPPGARFPKPRPIRVRYGAPLTFSKLAGRKMNREALSTATLRLMKKIQELKEESTLQTTD